MTRRFTMTLLILSVLAGMAMGQQYQSQQTPLFAANAKYLNGTSAGYAPTAGAGLTLNISSGRVNCANTMTNYAAGTLTMTNSTTNYVYLNTAASCAPASNTSGYTGTTIPIATVVTSGGVITSITDDRTLGMNTAVAATVTGGTCTNQVVTAISSSGVPTCTTVTSAYVNNSIALTGTDINTSNQVTATHLAAALPINQGGTATTGTLTGVVRGGNPFTASEISGDCTTSGSNAITCTKSNGTTTTVTIANGTNALGTSAISSGACGTATTSTATGAASTDNVQADFNADPTSTTGYIPGAMLTVVKWVSTNTVNFKQCNNTASSITPSAVTINWRVVR